MYTDEQYSAAESTADKDVRVYGRKATRGRRHRYFERFTDAAFEGVRRSCGQIRKEVKL